MTTILDSLKVEIDFTDGPDEWPGTWTDVTAWASLTSGVRISGHGRTGERDRPGAASLSLVLDNPDGRFTPGRSGSPYYPSVLPARKIRVSKGSTARFTGHVTDWSPSWPGSVGAWSQVVVTAVDPLGRWGARRPLRSALAETLLASSPVAYWPLGDSSSAVAAEESSGTASASALAPQQVGAGGSCTFGAGIGPGGDGQAAVMFARASSTAGVHLVGSLPSAGAVVGGPAATLTVRLCVATATSSQSLLRIEDDYGSFVDIGANASGQARLRLWDGLSGSWIYTVSSSSITDGQTHTVSAVLSRSGGALEAALHVDSTSGSVVTVGTWPLPVMRRVTVGGVSGEMATATVSHVALYSTALSAGTCATHHDVASTAAAGDTTSERLSRVAGWVGAPVYSGLASSETVMSAAMTAGQSLTDALADIERADGGRAYVRPDGTLDLIPRENMWRRPVSWTVDANATGHIDGLTPTMSTQGVVNDATGQRPTGPVLRVVNPESVADYGPVATANTYHLSTDAEVADRLWWDVNADGSPRVRVPGVAVNVLCADAATQAAVLGLQQGSRIQITGLPSQAPSTTLDLIVEGWSESISITEWTLTLTTSDASEWVNVWTVEDATHGFIDSDSRIIY